MFKKRRVATPGLGHTPYSPLAGGYADLQTKGVFPYCAMMQVAAEDTYEDYVICRGFDPRIMKFVDYEDSNPYKPGISVAKPFGNRIAGQYNIGEIYPALLPIQGSASYTPPSPDTVEWRLGQNPGVVDGATDDGHPADLTEAIVLLLDHNEKHINWIFASSNGTSDDPDTPFRQTVETSIASLTRGHTAPIFGDAADLTFDALNLHSQGGGASTANGASHGQAISAGTLGFFNEATGATTPILKKTSDGGFAPAIIYMLNENHKYAVCDSRLAQPADQRFLISTPYGPYRILSYNDLDPEVSEFPKFVYASIKDQTQDRDVSFYTVNPVLSYDSGDEAYDISFASWEAASDTSTGRHIFPELNLDTPKYRIGRNWFEEDAPVPLYIYRLFIHGVVERRIGSVGGTNYFNEILYEFEDTTATTRTLRFYNRIEGYRSTKTLGIETVFRYYDDTELVSSSFDPINLSSGEAFDPPSPSGTTAGMYQAWGTVVTGLWDENFKDVRFRIKTNGSSAVGMDTELWFGGPGEATVRGYLMLFRLGDRGAHPNAGSRTLSGFETVVSEPEPP